MSENRKSFVKGAAILGMAGILVKVLGAVFRIPLGNMVSTSAMAYYQPAYYIYTFFIVIATSGIPVAISKMVSERAVVGDYKGAHKAFKVSLTLMLVIGFLSFLILFFGAGPLSRVMNAPNAKYPMMVIAPAILMVPAMSAYRGYFQGLQNMNPTAVSQILEQIFRVAFGLTAAYILYHSAESVMPWAGDTITTATDVKGAMGAISGATVGSLAGLLIILFIYVKSRPAFFYRMRKYPDTLRETSGEILKKVLIIAVPITIGAAVMPIMNMIEVPIINTRLLDSGFTPEEADILYGMLSGYVVSLVNLPQVLTAALATSLVPTITAVYTQSDREGLKANTILGARLGMLVGAPCAIGMAVLAKPIMLLLYPAKPELAQEGSMCLTLLAIGIIFLAMTQTLTAILQGIGKQMVPVANLGVAIVIKIILTWVLVGIPVLNVEGAAIATTAAYAVATVLNIRAVKKYTGITLPPVLVYVRPLAASLIMGAFAFGAYKGLALVSHSLKWNALATLIVIGMSVILYVILLFATHSIEREDLIHLPKGEKLTDLYDRFTR